MTNEKGKAVRGSILKRTAVVQDFDHRISAFVDFIQQFCFLR